MENMGNGDKRWVGFYRTVMLGSCGLLVMLVIGIGSWLIQGQSEMNTQIGALNVQVARLVDRSDDSRDRINGLEKDVKTLSGDLDQLKDRINGQPVRPR